MNNNISKVLTRLIKIFNVPVTKQTVYDEVTKHPSFPSMLTISDALDKWKIPNGAYQLPFNELTDVPCPFIAHLTRNGGEFALVTKFDNQDITVYNDQWDNQRLKHESFKNFYSGTVILAESNEESGEKDFEKKLFHQRLNNLRIPFLLLTAFFVLFSRLTFNIPYGSLVPTNVLLLILIKTVGLIVSVLLLIQSIDANNTIIQRICSVGKKIDCNTILSSKAAKITSFLNWSEVGFFYFSGTWLILLFSTVSLPLLQFIALLSFVSLPYTFYSIYYQAKVAKKWCLLCCSIQGLLWLELIAFLPYLSQHFTLINYSEISNCLVGFIFPVALWVFVKPILVKANELEPVILQLNRFKYNPDLFWNLVNEQSYFELLPEESSLVLGNKQAQNIITIVSNPYCQPCSKAHEVLGKWLAEANSFKLQIIFSTSTFSDDPKTKVARHLMNLKTECDEKTLKGALDDWYNHKYESFEAWAINYPTNIKEGEESLQKQNNWCSMAKIEVTPSIFINGRSVPNTYQVEDLQYFI